MMAALELRYLAKTEDDFLLLLRKSEPLEAQQIHSLLELAEQTP